MKILLYAFSAFGNNATNISEQILAKIPAQDNLIKHVFPTRFDQETFTRVTDRYKPDLIIGMGQYPTGNKLRIEKVAKNEYRSKSHPITSQIVVGGPETAMVTYDLPTHIDTTITNDAGRYVCNYSMYTLGRWAESHRARFSFLHIPKSFPQDKAVAYLSQILKNQL